jgi:hypothetical protein
MPMMAKPGEVAGALERFARLGGAQVLAVVPPSDAASALAALQPVALPRQRIFLTDPDIL